MTPRDVRVLHIITRLIIGGAQENTLLTAIGQNSTTGFSVTLLAGLDEGREGDLHGVARAAGLDLVLLPSLVRPIRPLTDVRALIDLYRIIRRGRYDIVHTHSSKAGILGRVAARLAGVPIVVHTLHSLVFHEYESAWKNRLYVLLKRAVAPMTDVLISVNEATRRGALRAGIGRPAQHIVIYSGMPLEPFLSIADRTSRAEAKERLGISAGAPVVGKVARLSPLKGHDGFFRMAEEIARRRADVWFLLVGDGSLRESLEARASALGIRERTVFAGLVPGEEVPVCLHAMDVVVHTSLREGIARVLPQAGAVGLPVVTFDLDGAPEVIRDGVSGYLVPRGDTRAIAERVLELLDDPGRRRSFGEAGREIALANFGVDRMIHDINEVYRRLLERRKLRLGALAS